MAALILFHRRSGFQESPQLILYLLARECIGAASVVAAAASADVGGHCAFASLIVSGRTRGGEREKVGKG